MNVAGINPRRARTRKAPVAKLALERRDQSHSPCLSIASFAALVHLTRASAVKLVPEPTGSEFAAGGSASAEKLGMGSRKLGADRANSGGNRRNPGWGRRNPPRDRAGTGETRDGLGNPRMGLEPLSTIAKEPCLMGG